MIVANKQSSVQDKTFVFFFCRWLTSMLGIIISELLSYDSNMVHVHDIPKLFIVHFANCSKLSCFHFA